jgi:hypothetical protein
VTLRLKCGKNATRFPMRLLLWVVKLAYERVGVKGSLAVSFWNQRGGCHQPPSGKVAVTTSSDFDGPRDGKALVAQPLRTALWL